AGRRSPGRSRGGRLRGPSAWLRGGWGGPRRRGTTGPRGRRSWEALPEGLMRPSGLARPPRPSSALLAPPPAPPGRAVPLPVRLARRQDAGARAAPAADDADGHARSRVGLHRVGELLDQAALLLGERDDRLGSGGDAGAPGGGVGGGAGDEEHAVSGRRGAGG